MEYIFGHDSQTGEETLMTKGERHTDYSGYSQIVRHFDDCTITDSFYAIKKTKSSEDTSGNCYDWYTIDEHNRNTDFTPSLQKKNEELQKENELLKAQIKAQSDRNDFMEDCIAEMAMQVYS